MRRTVGQMNREAYQAVTNDLHLRVRNDFNEHLLLFLADCVSRKSWKESVRNAIRATEAGMNSEAVAPARKAFNREFGTVIRGAVMAFLLLLPLSGARAQGVDSTFKIQDSRWAAAASPVPYPAGPMPIMRQAAAAEPLGAKKPWTERRAYKFTAMAALHLAGAFDAYSTSQIFSVPPPVTRVTPAGTFTYTFWAHEWNPLLRPFAGTPAIYPAIQVGDGVFSAWLLRAKSPRSRTAAWIAVGVQIGLHVGLGLNNIRQANDNWAAYRSMTGGPVNAFPGRMLNSKF